MSWSNPPIPSSTTSLATLVRIACAPWSTPLSCTGITEEMLADVTTSLEDARARVMQHVCADTLLVGHSLENDLHALRLVHVNVLDTSLLFPHHKVGVRVGCTRDTPDRAPLFALRCECWLSATSSAPFRSRHTTRPTMHAQPWTSCCSSSSMGRRMGCPLGGDRGTSYSTCSPKAPGATAWARLKPTETVCTGAVWWSTAAATCPAW